MVFKSIFCDEHNTFLLKTLIERCLKTKIELIEIHSPERIKENIYAKGQRLDVLVKADNKLINIEVNSGYYEALHRKSFGYAGSKYAEEDAKKTNNTFKEIGKREGVLEEKIQIAKNLLKKNMSIQDISDVTGLPLKEIETLK